MSDSHTRTIDERPVWFGDCAGALAHGTRFFHWAAISVQMFADAVGYSFPEIIDADEIPYAPVGVSAAVERYPGVGDSIAVDATPTDVGDHRVVLTYEFNTGDGERLGEMSAAHVTIGSDGSAKPLPASVKNRLTELIDTSRTVDYSVPVADDQPLDEVVRSFSVRSPHVEAVGLTYFEEYPRFAAVSLEDYVASRGIDFTGSSDDRYVRLRSWDWSFTDVVPAGVDLTVRTSPTAIDSDRLCVSHEFLVDDMVAVRGGTEYGCFDESGERTSFADETVETLRSA